jgi:hypothetical protein
MERYLSSSIEEGGPDFFPDLWQPMTSQALLEWLAPDKA